MYVVIQKLQRKKVDRKGVAKSIESYSYTDPDGRIAYSYRYSEECFERSNTTTYKVSLRRSYREEGIIKQKQWCLFTASYYDLIEFCIDDFINTSKADKIIKEAGISVADFWDRVYMKVQPIIDQIRLEYEATEEFKVECKNMQEIEAYRERKRKFKDQYGECFYNYIYDFYGNLMNEELLEQVREVRRKREQYYRSSQNNSSYQDNNYDNYNKQSSYHFNSCSNYNEVDKKVLKKIYRAVASKFHPDNGKEGSEEVMMMLNRLKDEWGL